MVFKSLIVAAEGGTGLVTLMPREVVCLPAEVAKAGATFIPNYAVHGAAGCCPTSVSSCGKLHTMFSTPPHLRNLPSMP